MMGIATGISISTTCFVLLPNCRPNASVDHTHVNAINTGICIEHHLQVALTGNLIYQANDANPFIGVYLAGHKRQSPSN